MSAAGTGRHSEGEGIDAAHPRVHPADAIGSSRGVEVGLVAAWILAPTRDRAASLPDDQTHVLPCRPTIACTADLVDPGILELEVGYLHRRLSDEVNQESVPFLLKLTLARWVHLQVGGNGVGDRGHDRTQTGITAGESLR